MATTLAVLAGGKYLSLATFRRDGTTVATPVWLVPDGSDALLVVTAADSGKVKRLRADPRALVAPCDMRGNLTGEAVPATAELLDAAGTARAVSRISSRYGLMGRFLMWRGRRSERVGIRLRLAP